MSQTHWPVRIVKRDRLAADADPVGAQRPRRQRAAIPARRRRPDTDEHVGVVESVRPDGSVQTIEGNSSDQVSRRAHDAGSALGYVRMG